MVGATQHQESSFERRTSLTATRVDRRDLQIMVMMTMTPYWDIPLRGVRIFDKAVATHMQPRGAWKWMGARSPR
jgi:hypothetical protein